MIIHKKIFNNEPLFKNPTYKQFCKILIRHDVFKSTETTLAEITRT